VVFTIFAVGSKPILKTALWFVVPTMTLSIEYDAIACSFEERFTRVFLMRLGMRVLNLVKMFLFFCSRSLSGGDPMSPSPTARGSQAGAIPKRGKIKKLSYI
jgi:hypothetical protein